MFANTFEKRYLHSSALYFKETFALGILGRVKNAIPAAQIELQIEYIIVIKGSLVQKAPEHVCLLRIDSRKNRYCLNSMMRIASLNEKLHCLTVLLLFALKYVH